MQNQDYVLCTFLESDRHCPREPRCRASRVEQLNDGHEVELFFASVAAIEIETPVDEHAGAVFIETQFHGFLDETERRSPSILTNSYGRPWTSDGFRTSWS